MKRFLSVFLCVIMVILCIPTETLTMSSFASETEELVEEGVPDELSEQDIAAEEDSNVEEPVEENSEEEDSVEEEPTEEDSEEAASESVDDIQDDIFNSLSQNTLSEEILQSIQPVKLNATNFPDDNLRNYLEIYYDTDENQILSESEIVGCTELGLQGQQLTISDFTGIKKLPALMYMKVQFNGDVVDLSTNESLVYVKITGNSISELDLTNSSSLEWLEMNFGGAGQNKSISKIDVTNCSKLKYLCLYGARISTLQLDSCKDLMYLDIRRTELTQIDVTGLKQLRVLQAYDTKLTNLDISHNEQLEELSFGGYEQNWKDDLTELKFGKKPKLTNLRCYKSEIESIDLLSCTAIKSINNLDGELQLKNYAKCKNLTFFSTSGNNVTSMDFKGFKNLQELYFNDCNKLTTLNVSGCIALNRISCKETPITTLDVSTCTMLREIIASDCKQLNSVKFGKSNSVNYINCTNTKLLQSLDINKLTNLSVIYAKGSGLQSLDLRNNVHITTLELESSVELFVANETCYAYFYGAANGNKVNVTAQISVNEKSNLIRYGKTVQLSVSKIPETLQLEGKPAYVSANPLVATVSEDGVVTGVGGGNTTITITWGIYQTTCSVEVVVIPTTAEITEATVIMHPLEGYQLRYTCVPAEAIADLYWDTNTNLLHISKDGFIEAYRPGEVTIKLKSTDTDYLYDKVTVQIKGAVVTFKYDNLVNDRIVMASETKINEPEKPVKNGYNFVGWYNGDKKWDFNTDTVNIDEYEELTLTAKWELTPPLFVVDDIAPMTYTGSELKPVPVVHNSSITLKKGTDYSVTYTNNKNAGTAKAIVKAKGSYQGTKEVTFTISPKNIKDLFDAGPIIMPVNGKVQKPVPKAKYLGKTLKQDVDYTVTYPSKGNYIDAAEYKIVVTGKGNYTGSKAIVLNLTDKTFMSKCSCKLAQTKMDYDDGKELKPAVTVKYKTTLLAENMDYTVQYLSNAQIGTATVVITGKGKYIGTKSVTFKITGTSITKSKVSGVVDWVYTGYKAVQPDLKVSYKDTELKQGTDYIITYVNNVKAGKATIVITGIGKFSGTLKKNFTIKQYTFIDEDENGENKLQYNVSFNPFTGTESEVLFGTTKLVDGRDYTLSYKNMSSLYNKNRTQALICVIKGKGNFKGSVSTVVWETRVSDSMVNAYAPSIQYRNKPNNYKSRVTVKDNTGKTLAAGKSYDKEFSYFLYDSEHKVKVREIFDGETLPAGSCILTEISSEWVSDVSARKVFSCIHYIANKSIKNTTVTVKPQQYCGERVCLTKEDITVMDGTTTLVMYRDYIIVDNIGNNRAGTAKVTIRGSGNYMFEKSVEYQIAIWEI